MFNQYDYPQPIPTKNIWLPIFTTLIFYIGFLWLSQLFFEVHFQRNRWIVTDAIISLVMSYLILGISRSNLSFILIQLILFTLLFIGHGLKITVFGGPIMLDDIYSFTAMFNILTGWQFWLLVSFLGITSIILVLNLKFNNWVGLFCLSIMMMVGYFFYHYPNMINHYLNQKIGYVVWSQRLNYTSHGPFLYTLHETARFLATKQIPPDQASVENAVTILSQPSNPLRISATDFFLKPQRNVHLILLESFWDPTQLKNVSFSQDPLGKPFRDLWQSGGFNHVLSPVYGGYTANAEFEVLCGFPVEEDAVKFERRLKNTVPCLPALLSKAGYRTYASHPNIPSFWNRFNAYQRIGFEHSFFINHYQKIDMVNNAFMGDKTYYAQTLNLLAEAYKKLTPTQQQQPIFNYMVTIYGHLPYQITPDRPQVVYTKNTSDTVTAYANAMYYKANEFMDVMNKILHHDPNALIIAFGDHLPNLGLNFAGYTEAGFLSKNRSEFSELMIKNMHNTPLIIIDGQRGPINVGDIAMYQLPHIIIQLLGLENDQIFKLTRPPYQTIVRPLPGQTLIISKDNIQVCREPNQNCSHIENWLKHIRILIIDLFEGKQHTLKSIKN